MASQNLLGYIVIEGTEGQMRGAALAADMRGIPVDFIYTDPVRPTRLERIMLGNSMDTYLKEELMLEALLEGIGENPQIWICNDADLLDPLKTTGRVKAVLLSESPQAPLEAKGQLESTSDPGVFVLQAAEKGAPVMIEFPDGTRPDEVQQIAQILTKAEETMDILEPFTRIQKALASLSSSGGTN